VCPSSRYTTYRDTTYGDSYFTSIDNKLMSQPLPLSRHSESPKSIEFCRFSMLHQFYAMWSPQMLELSHIMTMFRGVICRGSHFHSGSQCSMCGQHQGLVDVMSFIVYVRWLYQTSNSCILTKYCWYELQTFGGRKPSIVVHQTTSGIPIPDCRPRFRYEPLKSYLQNPFKLCLKLHPPGLCANSCSIFPVILLHLISYILLIHALLHFPTLYLHYSKWNLRPARWGITIHRRLNKPS